MHDTTTTMRRKPTRFLSSSLLYSLILKFRPSFSIPIYNHVPNMLYMSGWLIVFNFSLSRLILTSTIFTSRNSPSPYGVENPSLEGLGASFSFIIGNSTTSLMRSRFLSPVACIQRGYLTSSVILLIASHARRVHHTRVPAGERA